MKVPYQRCMKDEEIREGCGELSYTSRGDYPYVSYMREMVPWDHPGLGIMQRVYLALTIQSDPIAMLQSKNCPNFAYTGMHDPNSVWLTRLIGAENPPPDPLCSRHITEYHSNKIHQLIPVRAAHENTVRNQAATFPPVVTLEGSGPTTGFPLVPADGSPWLVPPVDAVTGGAAAFARFACITSNALICWPTPTEPSKTPPLVHF